MRKEDIIKQLMQRGFIRRDATKAVNDIVSIIANALAEGEDVKIHGFGTFYVKEYKNTPNTDENGNSLDNYGAKAPKFTAGDTLKRAVREGFVRE